MCLTNLNLINFPKLTNYEEQQESEGLINNSFNLIWPEFITIFHNAGLNLRP